MRFGNQAVEHGHNGVGVDAAVHGDRQGLAGVLVDHVCRWRWQPVAGGLATGSGRTHDVADPSTGLGVTPAR